MLVSFFKDRKFKSVIPVLYNHIVAQSRQAQFYQDYHVKDDLDGRFNMLSLHMILVLDRLKSEGEDGETVSQLLVDHFFDDMDGVLRETGTGDMGVSHRIKKLANRFYGRMKVFQASLAADDDSLTEAVWRNVYSSRVEDGEEDAGKLAKYMKETALHLQDVPFSNFVKGKLIF